MQEYSLPDDSPIFCDRCSAELRPGRGNFYVVKIEAVADPSSPEISDEDLRQDHAQEIGRLFSQMRELSEQELLDSVYRRVTVYLCARCYRKWIENPTG